MGKADPVGIIFDCDGVMIDSAEANRFLYNRVLGVLGLPPLTREQEIFAFQATYQQALEALVPVEMHDRVPEATRTAVDYDTDILPKIKLMPGFREFIEKAHARGLKLAIDTNRTEMGIMKVLEHFHLPEIFAPIISSSNSEPKPSPQGAMKICAAWDADPARALFVGDSVDDRLAAEGAGVCFVGFNGLAGNFSVNSWEELAAILWPAAGAKGGRQ